MNPDRLAAIAAWAQRRRSQQRRPQSPRTRGPRNAPVLAAISSLLAAAPTASDRAIGRRVGCDHHVVASVRAQLGIAPRPRARQTDAARADQAALLRRVVAEIGSPR